MGGAAGTTRGTELLLFALTPPRRSVGRERAQEIADVTLERLAPLDLDGLVLYDIDDESDRNPDERPFPFLPTIDPSTFRAEHLARWTAPVVVYRAVSKYDEDELRAWLEAQDAEQVLTVLVGASSRHRTPATSLVRAQELWAQTRPDLRLGGVAIPERHTRRGDEHRRLVAKQKAGCSFFVTQVVYDVGAAQRLVADYRDECLEHGLEPVPVVLTFSVCGSVRTLELLQWLGVHVPRAVEAELRHADDPLQRSYELTLDAAAELIRFCRDAQVPFGVNVESVSARRVEIEASVRLAEQVGRMLQR